MTREERGDIIVGLDIGTTKICTVVGEVLDGQINILGIGANPSIGLRKGVVVNIESTVNSIKKSVAEAETMAGCHITDAYVGIAGSHVKGINSHGVVAVKDREISRDDINKVVENAKAIPLSQDQEIIHVLPQQFKVDDQDGIQDPLGMTGVRLEAEVHVVVGSTTAVHNIIKCSNKAGLEVADVVLEPVASAEAVFSPEELELGVALLDIGGGTSDMAVFADNCIRKTFVLGLGGHNLTNDLSVGLRTPMAEAEKLKEKYGCALASYIDKDQPLDIPSVGGRQSRKLSRKVMGDILEPRVEEMLTLINQELMDSEIKSLINAGLILTGGTAMLAHISDLAEQVFDMPVRIGYPLNVGGITEIINTPQCATGVGLVVYGKKNEESVFFHNRKSEEGGIVKAIKGLKGLFGRWA